MRGGIDNIVIHFSGKVFVFVHKLCYFVWHDYCIKLFVARLLESLIFGTIFATELFLYKTLRYPPRKKEIMLFPFQSLYLISIFAPQKKTTPNIVIFFCLRSQTSFILFKHL